jgi:hypothetical protein
MQTKNQVVNKLNYFEFLSNGLARQMHSDVKKRRAFLALLFAAAERCR